MMNKFIGILATVLISLTLTLSGINDAEAKRFGGARSFGGKSAYSMPYRRSAANKSTRSASQQQAYQKNQAARQNMSRRGGLMGLLGGLALGGLLGAMLFGGAFEGFNFMDILIFGGIAYLIYRMFAAKASNRAQTAYGQSSHTSAYKDDLYSRQNQNQQNSASFNTDVMFDKKQDRLSSSDLSQDADFKDSIVPEGFDTEDFLDGAKAAFRMLQTAWDQQDLAEIRGLTTDKVFAEIQDQLKFSHERNHTDVLKVDAELLSIRELENELEAVVLFDTILREEVDKQAEQIREVWHFIKPKNSIQPKWYLDGIQQLEQ